MAENKTEKTELKPCPGCGSTSVCVCVAWTRTSKEENEEWWRAHCQDCDWGTGGSSLCTSEQMAVDAWNTRTNTTDKED